MLQAQARFIEMFTVGSEAGRIWTNVLIVCKGKVRLPHIDLDKDLFVEAGKNSI